MGVLYAKVAGQWVPISPAGTVGPPAYAGPRTNFASDARFGHLAQATDMGFIARDEGSVGAQILGGKQFFVWDSVGGTFVQFKLPYSNINGWSMGPHPGATSYQGIWRSGNDALDAYVLLARSVETLINVPAGGTIGMRVGNIDKVAVTAGKVQTYQAQLSALKTVSTSTWADAQVMAECESGAAYNARVTLHQYYAPQWKVNEAGGERIQAVRESGVAYCPVAASAFEVGSALATKHDVRTLHPQRERIVVHHDPFMDEAPEPDIMALRPVAFRLHGGPPNHVEHGQDPIPDPLDSSFGIQATRQRLGLIADEVQHVIPSAVSYDVERQPMGIDYAQITVALLDHVQRLTDEVATLRYRVAELEGAS